MPRGTATCTTCGSGVMSAEPRRPVPESDDQAEIDLPIRSMLATVSPSGAESSYGATS